ncbi:EF-hand calcium-binding domain-containing protein 9-like [Lingula anatina]|uniref:EF-hand calcium-binding domain-containing protein 9-like n=2 Tax=Lingula anatina TaxID=7574 RepID=A0A1S3IAJ9_LINAN|nr:EF-hand calcium-binding domain-containing protein 9-like [Lingula anatina]|eukprot:XP_013394434.1 EF-hand calcium-binding domain-containing protein 9-like [Lingula anatina]
MKVRSHVLQHLHLDKSYSLLTGRNVKIILEIFKLLDIHGKMCLNDIQFYHYMRQVTDLDKKKIYKVFDMLDVDGSGEIDFDEFYLLSCILIAIKEKQEKQFIFRHSRTVFELLDEDGSGTISAEELGTLGFLFNFRSDAVKGIFEEFDVTGDQELDYKEFRMFAMAAIDKQNEMNRIQREKWESKKQNKIMKEKREMLKDMKKQGVPLVTVTETANGIVAQAVEEPETNIPALFFKRFGIGRGRRVSTHDVASVEDKETGAIEELEPGSKCVVEPTVLTGVSRTSLKSVLNRFSLMTSEKRKEN